MIRSRKHKLLIALLLVCTCGLTLGAEPNEAETELKIEIRNERPSPMLLRTRRLEPPYGSTTHCALLFIFGDWVRLPTISVDAILATSAGRAMSQKQRELVSTLPFRYIDFGGTIGNHTYFRLYGVGEDDTKKMVEAFIEILTEKADARMQEYEKFLNETKERIVDIIENLPEKQKQAKEAESKYNEIKDARYFSLYEGEAYKKARETMFQMAKMLDVLEIELVGIEVKLKAIEEYRSTHRLPDKRLSDNTVDKLEQMYVEQMIELRSAKARQNAALQIRERKKEFLNLFNLHRSLRTEVHGLENDLYESEKELSELEERLANPKPDMLPPKVFQNKVTIYPVQGGR